MLSLSRPGGNLYDMTEFILFMHDDAVDTAIASDGNRWAQYMASLRASGRFDGGSSVGTGTVFRKGRADTAAETVISGYLRVRAESADAARRFLVGNPVYEAGGTVEIRELPRS